MPLLPAIRAARQPYCDAIDRLIVESLPHGATSLLDVGAGDGTRAMAVAQRAAITDVVLLEPSAGMRGAIRCDLEVWTSRIENLPPTSRRFDVITCLWNVLGHVPTPHKRLRALENMRSLLSPAGLLFLDVQNRYNARAYGSALTLSRWLRDHLAPSAHNGDVTVCWPSALGDIATYGHVFTPHEMADLIRGAGLKMARREFVDYSTGEVRSSQFTGSIFFVLSREG